MRRKDLVAGAHYAAGPRTTYDIWSKDRVEVLSTEKQTRKVYGDRCASFRTDDGVKVRVVELASSHVIPGGADVIVIPTRNILEPWEDFVEKRGPALALAAERKAEGEARKQRVREVIAGLAAHGVEAKGWDMKIHLTLEQAEVLLDMLGDLPG